MTNVTQVTLKEEIDQNAGEVIALRRYFHQYPEASLKEFETIKKIKTELTKLDIPFENVGETGVFATIEGERGPGKAILLRADIDALELADATGKPYQSKNEGLNHACGHDGHAAALLGAAKVLKNHTADFSGRVHLAFQPAEEIGAGACQFVAGGFVDDIDRVFGIHLDSNVPVGKLVATNASCDIFKIEVEGLSSHVAQPNVGRNAVLAAASIVVELQKIAAREVSPLDPVVVGVGVLDAGTRYNIVANHAKIEGTVRAFSHEIRAFVLQRVEEIANQVAKAHRTTIRSFHIHDAAGPLINEAESTELAQNIAAEIVGAENVITDYAKSLGADDFADFLLKVPGVYGRVGTRNLANPDTHYGHHHEKFDIDESALALATAFHVQYALNYLNQVEH